MSRAEGSVGWRRIAASIALLAALLGILYATGEISLRGALAAGAAAALIGYALYRSVRRDMEAFSRATVQRLRRQQRAGTPLRSKIVEGVPDPLLLLAPDKRVVEANRAARDLLGERIMSNDIALYLRHPDALDTIEEAIASESTAAVEITLTAGTERIYIVGASRVENAQAEPVGNEDSDEPPFYIVVSLHDITQVRLAERMRADFVANASHELRTPLSSLIGFIETLQGAARGDVEAADRFLSIMQEEAMRMVRLIDDLLSLSRIELDKHVQPDTGVDIAGVLEGAAASLQPAAQKRGMTIEIEAAEPLPQVRGDRDQLLQVMQNLISNAIKYARPDTQITLRAAPVARVPGQGSAGVRIDVQDRGEGIAPEHLPRLTERFYRVDAARSRKLGGTGLGLAIVKHIVNRHRGHLDIDSLKGEGTTVSAWLPQLSASQGARGGASAFPGGEPTEERETA